MIVEMLRYSQISRGKKILKCSLVPWTSTPKFELVLFKITLGIQGNITLHYVFFTCPSDIGWKYMLVLIEILLVPGSRTSDFFTPDQYSRWLREPEWLVAGASGSAQWANRSTGTSDLSKMGSNNQLNKTGLTLHDFCHAMHHMGYDMKQQDIVFSCVRHNLSEIFEHV